MTLKEFCIKSQRRLLAYFYKAISGMYHPDNSNVMFFTFQGTYACNPKYICRKLLEKKPDLNCIWVVLDQNDKKDFPEGLTTVLFGAPVQPFQLRQAALPQEGRTIPRRNHARLPRH